MEEETTRFRLASVKKIFSYARPLPVVNGPLRLRFVLQNAALYSFKTGDTVNLTGLKVRGTRWFNRNVKGKFRIFDLAGKLAGEGYGDCKTAEAAARKMKYRSICIVEQDIGGMRIVRRIAEINR